MKTNDNHYYIDSGGILYAPDGTSLSPSVVVSGLNELSDAKSGLERSMVVERYFGAVMLGLLAVEPRFCVELRRKDSGFILTVKIPSNRAKRSHSSMSIFKSDMDLVPLTEIGLHAMIENDIDRVKYELAAAMR